MRRIHARETRDGVEVLVLETHRELAEASLSTEPPGEVLVIGAGSKAPASVLRDRSPAQATTPIFANRSTTAINRPICIWMPLNALLWHRTIRRLQQDSVSAKATAG